jgi:TPP-dependent pyruvate/acetoin dehydrogenase alpha subunit
MDAIAVYEAAAEAIDRARKGEGPTLLECKTYRFYDHVGRDFGILKRDESEVAHWRSRDPIGLLRATMIEQGVLTDAEADEIVEKTRVRIDEAVEFAEQSPEPDPTTLLDDVYTEATA